ncbi:hypothetical protein EYF80_006037 [Liparis tanakae]|uniref:Uncharacterized protein n=1 Tax=Liparis tanakae TaxID=230148 RepID=A0A4Z2IZY5_9TELE|nr:hypothetical protein EYF80_006037 [Liparis tanakae]
MRNDHRLRGEEVKEREKMEAEGHTERRNGEMTEEEKKRRNAFSDAVSNCAVCELLLRFAEVGWSFNNWTFYAHRAIARFLHWCIAMRLGAGVSDMWRLATAMTQRRRSLRSRLRRMCRIPQCATSEETALPM